LIASISAWSFGGLPGDLRLHASRLGLLALRAGPGVPSVPRRASRCSPAAFIASSSTLPRSTLAGVDLDEERLVLLVVLGVLLLGAELFDVRVARLEVEVEVPALACCSLSCFWRRRSCR
jgi:hypothetical protein